MKASAFRDSTFPLLPLGNVVTERAEYVDSIDFPPLSVGIEGITKQLEGVAKAASTSGRKLVRAGDLAINSRSDRRGACGLASTTGSVSIVNSVFTPHPEKLVPQFAHHLLRSKAFQEEYFRFGTGIVDDLWSTRFPRMRQIRIPLPDLPTQRRIADYLDRETAQIDAMAGALDGLVARLAERRQAIIEHHVSGRTGGDVQGGAGMSPNVPLWSALTETDDRAGAQASVLTLLSVSKTRGVVRYSSLFPERVARANTLTNYKIAKCDDIVLNKMSAASGAVGVANENGLVSPDYAVFRVRSENEPRYLNHLLRSDWILSQVEVSLRGIGTGDSQNVRTPRIAIRDYLSLRAPLPDLPTQRRIADYLDRETAQIDAMIAKAGELRALLDERRSALITATVTGQHPVPEEP